VGPGITPRIAATLLNLEETLSEITKLVARGRDVVEDDDFLPMAAQFLGIRLGEDVSNLTEEWRDAHPEVPWHDIRSLRNRLAHDYHSINFDLLWKAFSTGVPAMREMLAPAFAAAHKVAAQESQRGIDDSE
jgi:uncharacterized protein with HEPN domain